MTDNITKIPRELLTDERRYKVTVRWKDGKKDVYRGLDRIEASQIASHYESKVKVEGATVEPMEDEGR